MPSPVRRILQTWVTNVNRGDVEAVLGLYADDAVLLATFDPAPADTPAAIRAYFEMLGAKAELSVTLDEATIREHGQAISGLYTFAHGSGPERQSAPSRFTFVVDQGQERPILHHHSSVLP